MRARIPTDDYMLFEGETWDIIDMSLGKTVFCGVCSGYSLYGSRSTVRDNYTTYLVVRDGMLKLARTNSKMHPPDWRYQYDRFVDGGGLDDKAAYTGWMLVGRGSRVAYGMSGLLESDEVMELCFEEGRLVEQSDPSDAIEALRGEFPELLGNVSFWRFRGESEDLKARARELLKGDYNFINRKDGLCVKQMRLGFSRKEKHSYMWNDSDLESTLDYDCAICKKLRENEVLPLRAPKRPRKKRYREASRRENEGLHGN